jgi:hypothetical protein
MLLAAVFLFDLFKSCTEEKFFSVFFRSFPRFELKMIKERRPKYTY